MPLKISILALCIGVLTPTLAFATTPDDVLGTWKTGIGEQPAPDGGTAYLQVTTVFTETAQDLIFEIFADEALQMPLFKYHSSGPWDPQGASAEIPGAMEVNMTNDFSRVEIFVDAPEIWEALNMADCPLEIGVAVEVADCVNGPPFIVSDCLDMDLVMVDQDGQRLRYGGGDVNRCEVRPTEMSADAYFKVE
ncbi:hypothetical protein [uncultured Tateyamaria sp.]|uniref:hypothetical protein n=1 Tax=uncultured Tateyamaria sp. TaxID=455651 RepID=UPI0026150143|nr:hypothetical protein [uncultured Tateyamaria sp.]